MRESVFVVRKSVFVLLKPDQNLYDMVDKHAKHKISHYIRTELLLKDGSYASEALIKDMNLDGDPFLINANGSWWDQNIDRAGISKYNVDLYRYLYGNKAQFVKTTSVDWPEACITPDGEWHTYDATDEHGFTKWLVDFCKTYIDPYDPETTRVASIECTIVSERSN